jgi:hypothetical protein
MSKATDPQPSYSEKECGKTRADAYVDCPDCLGRGYHGTGTDGPCDTCYGDKTLDARHVQALGGERFWRDKYQEQAAEGKRAAAVVEAARKLNDLHPHPVMTMVLAAYDAEARAQRDAAGGAE